LAKGSWQGGETARVVAEGEKRRTWGCPRTKVRKKKKIGRRRHLLVTFVVPCRGNPSRSGNGYHGKNRIIGQKTTHVAVWQVTQ